MNLNIGINGYSAKPETAAKVNKELLADNAIREVTPEKMAQLVACKGHPFIQALFSTRDAEGALRRTKAYFTSQEIIAIDIDNKDMNSYKSIDETISYCIEYGLYPFLVYPTYSSTDDRQKYRVVFRLNKVLRSIREAEALTRMMHEIIPWADSACKDITHIFYGSVSWPVEHDEVSINNKVSPESIVIAWQSYIKEHDKSGNGSRTIKTFAAEYGIAVVNNLLALKCNLPPYNEQCLCLVGDQKRDDFYHAANIYSTECAGTSTGNVAISGGPDIVFAVLEPYDDYLRRRRNSEKRHKAPRPGLIKMRQLKKRPNVIWSRHQADILSGCKLVSELFEGNKDKFCINHHEFFHMATAFLNIEGGSKVFKGALDDYAYKATKRISQFNIISGYNYFAQRCRKSGCRFLGTCSHAQIDEEATILGLTFKRGNIFRYEEVKTASLAEIRAELPHYFDAAVTSAADINVVRVDCGVGKTFMMIQKIMELYDKGNRIIYAAPTHRLLEETVIDLRKAMHDIDAVFRIPDLQRHIERRDSELGQKIRQLWNQGQHSVAATAIRGWAQMVAKQEDYMILRKQNGVEEISQEGKDITDYLLAMEKVDKSEPAIFCVTHARMIFSKIKADIAFVDEDILIRCLLTCGSVRISDLEIFEGNLRRSDIFDEDEKEKTLFTIRRIFKEVRKAKYDDVVPMLPIDHSVPAEILKKCSSDRVFRESSEEMPGGLIGFLSSSTVAFLRSSYQGDGDTIHFISRYKLPERLGKIIIASATANEQVYRAFFDNVYFLDTPQVKYRGRLIIHPELSYSNQSLRSIRDKRSQDLENILRRHPEACLICTKECSKMLNATDQKRVVCTYGATEGFNTTAGQDHVIIGLLHKPPYVYKLMAYALGHQSKIDAKAGSGYVEVRHKGFRFCFQTYGDELLRAIQFYQIETDLVQAVGRARLGDHDCEVHVYTNYPLPQATLARVS